MEIEATQALPLSDYDDETDEELSDEEKKPVSIFKHPHTFGMLMVFFAATVGVFKSSFTMCGFETSMSDSHTQYQSQIRDLSSLYVS